METIQYRCGYRYQLVAPYQTFIDIRPATIVGNDWVYLSSSGLLVIERGYAWDGPSGPTEDTPDSMRGSLVHDALYQLLREEFLSPDHRERADGIFLEILLADGMLALRAAAWHAGVRLAASDAALPKSIRPVLFAPLSDEAFAQSPQAYP